MSKFDPKRARTKRPIPLWADAFLRDTMSLPAEAIGSYMLILMAMWSRPTCDLPDNDRQLATIARVSTRHWNSTLGPMLRPFLKSGNGTVTQERLKKEADYTEVSITRQSDKRSGKSLVSLEADEPVDIPQIDPTQLPNNPTLREEDGGGSAGAGEAENPQDQGPTFREEILEAIGVDKSGMTGHGGCRIGGQGDMAEAFRWLDLPGVTEAVAIAEIRAVMGKKRDGPPSSFRFFSKAMERLSGSLTLPPLNPIQTTAGAKYDRSQSDRAINELANKLTDGSITIDYSNRDPFAVQRRGDT